MDSSHPKDISRRVLLRGICPLIPALRSRLIAAPAFITAFTLGVSQSQAQIETLTGLPAVPEIVSGTAELLNLPFEEPSVVSQLLIMSLLCALTIFVLVAGFGFMRERRRSRENLLAANLALQTLQAKLDQSESLLNASDQMLIIWQGRTDVPQLHGNLNTQDATLPHGLGILAFGTWLEVECAQQIEEAIDRLRSTGQRFLLVAQTLNGGFVEFKGRTSGSRALLQLRTLEGDDLDRAQLEFEATRHANELARMRSLLDEMPMPVWSRDEYGQLSWVNRAYQEAVEEESIEAVLDAQTELLDQRGRDSVQQAREQTAGAASTVNRLPVIVAGKRQIFDVVDVQAKEGQVGIATDVSSIESAEKTLERMQAFHTSTMDQLTTPVAIYDSNRQLQYYNAAYAVQFKLDMRFLETHPNESTVLDRMRTNRCLPEQADFHRWKAEHLASYREVGMREDWWHLPDGQSLRAVSTPNPDGGVTYLFENVTEQLELEKRYKLLFQMQRETLDHLNDGVVVFGSDGRLRVYNPAFTRLWEIEDELLNGQPHVSAVLERCRKKFQDQDVWDKLKACVVDFNDARRSTEGRMECNDGRYLDFASIPLPDGATMITFVDVTDNVTVAQGLQDRNEALLAADHLKNTFIQHVSYELRSPLTNIIGFTELLTSEAFGALNERQREYTDHIMKSSSSLLAIVNDILDLATIDAGIMALELAQVDPVDSIRAAAEGLQDRLAERNIKLDISVAENMGEFVGDPKRVRQVLFNLISNAIAFSEDHSSIFVVADRDNTDITFTVTDQGCGIPNDYLETAFDRFESRKSGSSRRGAGLGLSIVKSFVELHGGSIHIESKEGDGTQVTCSFPIEAKIVSPASEEAAE
ncbi:PAS domain-containing sensor histidine kinase [Cohaesibacter sp. ES.047]|uniref:PAS domain-containing sensor histidine kinase n=1 Tax=Cohaesibacter sp. ES.047 TaxID=1798205 RepID=UPI001560D334|nr:PAS domain-containing sensor histidine kinase [Cohaesibacter sp. ES.047]